VRVFHCDRCGDVVAFDAMRCPGCGDALGYLSDELAVRTLASSADPGVFSVAGDDRALWRCLNAAWGCNWMLPAGSATPWCRSCSLTRGRPDEQRTVAMTAWMSAEAAKRRVVHQLDSLELPIEPRSDGLADGLAFDLVHLPSEGGITGHLDGVITLDLVETDEGHRSQLRRDLDERFRTVIGHLRHEMGHYYWRWLVGQCDDLAQFRLLFGDERDDYAEALERHYSGTGESWDPTRFVTAYAASHPLEDWAESFAHYLHIIDATDTAVAHDLIPTDGASLLIDEPLRDLAFAEVLAAWQPINDAVTAVAESLGAPPLYPFQLTGAVVDKLAFVHERVAARSRREHFHAAH
jgi:hypothetical protein